MPRRKHSVKKNRVVPCTDANQRVRESLAAKKKQVEREQRLRTEYLQRLQAQYEAQLAAQKNANVAENNQMMDAIPSFEPVSIPSVFSAEPVDQTEQNVENE